MYVGSLQIMSELLVGLWTIPSSNQKHDKKGRLVKDIHKRKHIKTVYRERFLFKNKSPSGSFFVFPIKPSYVEGVI